MELSKFVGKKGSAAKMNATKKAKHFTVLGLTSLTGKPVMCVVIIAGKGRNLFVESGIDCFHEKSKEFQYNPDHEDGGDDEAGGADNDE